MSDERAAPKQKWHDFFFSPNAPRLKNEETWAFANEGALTFERTELWEASLHLHHPEKKAEGIQTVQREREYNNSSFQTIWKQLTSIFQGNDLPENLLYTIFLLPQTQSISQDMSALQSLLL